MGTQETIAEAVKLHARGDIENAIGLYKKVLSDSYKHLNNTSPHTLDKALKFADLLRVHLSHNVQLPRQCLSSYKHDAAMVAYPFSLASSMSCSVSKSL